MNLTLVLTGLATFGSLGFYGWSCEQSAQECTNAFDCPADQGWLSVRVGAGERRSADTSEANEERETRGASLVGSVRLLP